MKITAIEIGKIAIPLKTPFITALRRVDVAEDLVVKVYTDDGHVGYGNAPATVVITGDSHQSVAGAVREVIGPKLIGMDIDDRDLILETIQGAMVHNTSAKAALDIAVHDLFGQRYGMPLYRFFGGRRQRIASDLTISVNPPDLMAADAVKAVQAGYHHLKLKVGIDSTVDFERVAAIRKAVGKDIAIRLDANQGWKPKEAIRLIRAMEDADLAIELIEQPVSAVDFEGLKQVTDHVDTPIMADESAFSPTDVFRLLSMRACDLINIKLMKCGGLTSALKIAALAEISGMECMIGCMLEAKVSVNAAVHLACAKKVITRVDLDGPVLCSEDPIDGGAVFNEKEITVSDAPGLGIKGIRGLTYLDV